MFIEDRVHLALEERWSDLGEDSSIDYNLFEVFSWKISSISDPGKDYTCAKPYAWTSDDKKEK